MKTHPSKYGRRAIDLSLTCVAVGTFLHLASHLNLHAAPAAQKKAANAKPIVTSTKWDSMDLGPWYGGGLKEWSDDPRRRTGDSLCLKGISIRLGASSQATLTWDSEMLRPAYAWTGGFVRLPVGREGLEGIAEPNGQQAFRTQYGPGWADADGSFDDPRPVWEGESQPYGPLPRSWAHWEGLYRFGRRVVLEYTVQDGLVLESPDFETVQESGIFTRTLNLEASERTRRVLVAQDPDGDVLTDGRNARLLLDPNTAVHAGVLGYPGAKFTDGGRGRLALDLPPTRRPMQFKIAMWRGPASQSRTFSNRLSQLSPARDLKPWTRGGASLWTEKVTTEGRLGKDDQAYTVDALPLPEKNPWNSWIRCSGVDFFSDGRAAICSVSGDVWVVSGIQGDLKTLTWKRYATGLFQPLGLRIVQDRIHVTCRDQITRLHDLNGDDEADYYENFNNDVAITSHYHEFCLNLETDSQGNFYFIKGGNLRDAKVPNHGTVMRVSPDGEKLEIVATGHRAPNGLGIGPGDEITSSDNEGNWVPTSRINWIRPGGFYGHVYTAHTQPPPTQYDPPLCWLPHQIDNSSGGQVWVTSDQWGPLKGQLLHTSYGKCRLFLVFHEEVLGVQQGGVVQFPLSFESGIMRGRFNPHDGQLYLAGLRVWQSSGVRDGTLARVRYTGKPVYLPIETHVVQDGLQLRFLEPLDRELAEDPESWAVDQWNYRWAQEYGSKLYSVADPEKTIGDKKQSVFGGENVPIRKVELSEDGKNVHLVLESIQPVMQMRVRYNLEAADETSIRQEVFLTIHQVPGQKAAKAH